MAAGRNLRDRIPGGPVGGATSGLTIQFANLGGVDATTPSLSARVDGGKVIGFEVAVNPAGE